MTFKDVASKNFRIHVKKYLSYFLCSSFSIMLFFMYSTLLFNNGIKANDNFDLITFLLYMAMSTVGLFAVFFINYAHTAFIKSRYKEFGLYMTLGMTSKDIQGIITFENISIICASLFAGLMSGLIFSRLFQMIVIKLLNLKNITYSMTYKSFFVTILVFVIVFAGVIAIGRFSTRNLEISQLLKKARQSDMTPQNGILPGFVGVLLILASLIILHFIAKDEDLNTDIFTLLSFIIVSFSGTYMIISNLGRTILGVMRRNDSLYYKNILTVTEISHRFNQNKRIIFILTILSAMIVFFVGSPFALLKMSENISALNHPNHIEYAEVSGINMIPAIELDSLLKSAETPAVNQSCIEFINLGFFDSTDKYDALHVKPIISQKLYNEITKTSLPIPKGQIMNIITAWEPGYHGILPSSRITFTSGSEIFKFTVLDSIHTKWITAGSTFPSSSGIVMNDEDYMNIRAKVAQENIGTFHTINFTDWKKTEGITEAIKASLDKANHRSVVTDSELLESIVPTSRLESYNDLKQGYSLFIFVTTIMGVLFFVAAGSVLYFKQFTELSSTKAKFLSLYRLGIRDKEASEIIAKELKFIFFTPLILGSVLGYAFMYLVTHIVGGKEVIGDFMLSATYAVAAYFIFQAVFYMITKRKFVGEVLEDNKRNGS